MSSALNTPGISRRHAELIRQYDQRSSPEMRPRFARPFSPCATGCAAADDLSVYAVNKLRNFACQLGASA